MQEPDSLRVFAAPREGKTDSREDAKEKLMLAIAPPCGHSRCEAFFPLMRSLLLLAASLMLTGCLDIAGPTSREAVATVISPDGSIQAVLFETNGGATTSYGYEIELHGSKSGNNPVMGGSLYGATRSECGYGVNLRWLSSTQLAIQFLEADQADMPATVRVGRRTVQIVPQRGVSDETAPCGGMLANLG